jgi:hypothetical protein
VRIQTHVCLYTHNKTPAPQERGTNDGGGPLAVRRAHRAKRMCDCRERGTSGKQAQSAEHTERSECAIAGSEETSGNQGHTHQPENLCSRTCRIGTSAFTETRSGICAAADATEAPRPSQNRSGGVRPAERELPNARAGIRTTTPQHPRSEGRATKRRLRRSSRASRRAATDCDSWSEERAGNRNEREKLADVEHCFGEEVHGRQDEQKRIESVEEPAVARQDGAHVLYA